MNATFWKSTFNLAVGVTLVFMGVLNYFNEGAPGGADNYMHFLFAKWAFTHPELFFNHWAKPLLVICTAPFAQLGYKAVISFQILVGLAAGLLAKRVAEESVSKWGFLAFFYTVFSPIFFKISFSTLTEILFAFVGIASLFLYSKQKYFWSAFVMALIIFSRTEGFIFTLILGVALLLRQEYKSMLGFVVGYSIITIPGIYYHHDWLWPITKSPYGNAVALYGTGDLWHFVESAPRLFGAVMVVLFGIGVLALFIRLAQVGIKFLVHPILLAMLMALGYFSAHSLVWFFGIGGSLGLTRVMAGIVPFVAVVSVYGVGFVYQMKPAPFLNWLIWGVLIVVIITGPTSVKYPIPLKREAKLIRRALKDLTPQLTPMPYVVYYDPLIAFELGIDHFDPNVCRERIEDAFHPSLNLPVGALVFWDSHFGPNEGITPLATFLDNPHFELVAKYQPLDSFQLYTGEMYELYVFRKVSDPD